MDKGWKISKLNHICLIKGRIGYRGYTKEDLVNEGEGALSLSPSNIKNNKLIFNKCTYISWFKYEESPEIMVFEGDIIYCKTASIGKMALVDFLPVRATLNPQFVVLKNIKCSNKLLYYYMISEAFKKQIDPIIGGTAVPTLSQKNLGNLNIPLPPHSEQQSIVEKLDFAFDAIEKAKANIDKNIENAKELFQSKLNAIFSQKGEGWEEKKIEEVCESIVAGGDAPKSSFSTEKTSKYSIPIYANAVKLDGLYGYTKLSKIKKPSLSIAARGSGTGFTCIRLEPFFPIVRLLVLTPNEYVNLKFLKLSVDNQVIKASGSAIPQFTVPMLKKLNIYLPKAVNEQSKIVNQMDQLFEQTTLLQEKYKTKLANIEELKKSILEKAFKGELV